MYHYYDYIIRGLFAALDIKDTTIKEWFTPTKLPGITQIWSISEKDRELLKLHITDMLAKKYKDVTDKRYRDLYFFFNTCLNYMCIGVTK